MADDAGAADCDGYEEDQAGGCGPCARGGGVLLIVIGAALGWMGADLVTGGALTRLVTGGIAAGIAATSAAGTPVDGDGDPGDSDGDPGDSDGDGDGETADIEEMADALS